MAGHTMTMCNDYRSRVDADAIHEAFAELKIKLRFPDGIPNLEPRDDIRITDAAPIIRAASDTSAVELVQRRWSWPGPGKKPVYNFRSDGREFTTGRCLIVADGFYEFTSPADPNAKRKDKWLFTKSDEVWFCIAGLWRSTAEVGEAFTMLTTEPGPDIVPYHDRQIVVLHRSDWKSWLNPEISARDIIKPLPAGTLKVERVSS